MAGFAFMLANRSHALQGLGVAVVIAVVGSLIYLLRARRKAEWPFEPFASHTAGHAPTSDPK
jgi:hypothetical protein